VPIEGKNARLQQRFPTALRFPQMALALPQYNDSW